MSNPNLPDQSNIQFESTRRINIKDIALDTTETENTKVRHRRIKISGSLLVLIVCITTYFFIQSSHQDITDDMGNIDINLALPDLGSRAPTTENKEAFAEQGSPTRQMIDEQQQPDQDQDQDYTDRYARYGEETYFTNDIDTEDTGARSPASIGLEEFVEVQEPETLRETPAAGEP
jgi:hypothetical protein